jgi:hypothetical protein
MRLKSGPFVIAAGVGAAVQFAIALLGTLGSFFAMGPLFNNSTPGSASGAENALILSSVLSGLVCLCALGLDVGVGAGYSVLARRSGEVDMGDGAIGGLLSATVARLISGLFGTVVGVVVATFMLNQQAGLALPNGDPSLTLVTAGSSAVSGLIGVCVGAVVAAVLGAGGGAVAAALVSRSAS